MCLVFVSHLVGERVTASEYIAGDLSHSLDGELMVTEKIVIDGTGATER